MGRPAAEIAAEDAALLQYGWIPGRDRRECVLCKGPFTGDKRAVMCRPHALAAYEAKINPGAPVVIHR